MYSAHYSRYADDLAFSWSADDEPPPFRNLVEDKLRRFDYRIQPSKGWRLQRRNERPEITGLALDGRRLRLSERIVERIRQLKRQQSRNDGDVRARLRGYWVLRQMLK